MKLDFSIKKKNKSEIRYHKMQQVAKQLKCENVAEAIRKIGKKAFNEQLKKNYND